MFATSESRGRLFLIRYSVTRKISPHVYKSCPKSKNSPKMVTLIRNSLLYICRIARKQFIYVTKLPKSGNNLTHHHLAFSNVIIFKKWRLPTILHPSLGSDILKKFQAKNYVLNNQIGCLIFSANQIA